MLSFLGASLLAPDESIMRSAILRASTDISPRRKEAILFPSPYGAMIPVTDQSPTQGRFFPVARPGLIPPFVSLIFPTSSAFPSDESTAIIVLPMWRRETNDRTLRTLSAVIGEDSVPYTNNGAPKETSISPTSGPRQSPVARSEPMQTTIGIFDFDKRIFFSDALSLMRYFSLFIRQLLTESN